MDLVKVQKRRIKTGDILHLLFNIALPVVVFLMVAVWQLYALALLLVLLSKWRILAVRPRFWWANIQANMVDIIVGISFVGLMLQADGAIFVQAIWALLYLAWQTYLKPQSSTRAVAIQAAVAQLFGVTALFWYADNLPDIVVVAAVWFICYSVARHFISVYEEGLTTTLSLVWGLFGAQLAWLLNRWLIVYDISGVLAVPQIAIILLIVGYCVAHLYDDAKNGKLTARQLQYVLGFGGVLLFLVLTLFSRWSGVI